jgi:putative ABC transport system permease protein
MLALRHLARHKTFSFINIGGLAVSMASCVFIFYFVYDEFTYDRFHTRVDRIHRITQVFRTKEGTQNLLWTNQKLGPHLKRVYPQVEEFVRIEDVDAVFKNSEKETEGIVRTDASVFNVFTYPMIEGNPNTALKELYSIVISESLSKKYFNGIAMGQTVEIEGEHYEVTGVMRDVPSNSDKWINALARGEFGGEEDEEEAFAYQTYILLREGEDQEFIRSQLSSSSQIMVRGSGEDLEYGYDMQALTDLHFHMGTGMDNPKGNEANTKILAVVAGVLLIVALFNFINLTTVISLERAKEVGVRKVAGAQRGQLIRQFIGESSVAVAIAAVLAVLLVGAMSSIFTSVSGKHISFHNDSDLLVVGGISLLLTTAAIVSSLYPAWILSSYRPVKAMKNEVASIGSGGLLRKILTTLQFGLSTALLIFLATVLYQTNFMRSSDPGFNKEKVVVLEVPYVKKTASDRDHAGYYVEEFLKISSVSEVGIGGFASTPGTPDVIASPIAITVNGEKKEPIVANTTADKHYTSILGLNAIEGSSFHNLPGDDMEGKAIVNQAFVKLAGWKNPIGEKIHNYAGDAEIVGIIPDFHFKSMHSKIEPLVILGTRKNNSTDVRQLFLKTNATDIDALRTTWQRLFPNDTFEYYFLSEYFDKQYQAEMTLQTIFLYFTLVTILIAGSGLFGLTIHHVEKKTREISIRKVLGAGVGSLIRLLSGEFLYLTGVGIVLGAVAGYIIASRWLTAFAYHIEPTVASPILLIVMITLIILVYRTYVGSVQNPVRGLKQE